MNLQTSHTIITISLILVIAAAIITTLVVTSNPLALLGIFSILLLPAAPQAVGHSLETLDMYGAQSQPEMDDGYDESSIGFLVEVKSKK